MASALPVEVIRTQASRGHRLHHFLWHETRNRWNLPPDPDGLTDEAKTALRELGWEPPRPALDASRRPVVGNHSGEDFLYMHRRMIERVNLQLATIADPEYPRIEGWLTVPPQHDPGYPVPPAWFVVGNPTLTERLRTLKSQAFLESRLRFWERQFTDPNYLRGMSLGELGARSEFTIHNQLHMRFAAQPPGERPDPSPDPSNPASIPVAWDDPRYDYLGDTYSSHVNPVFWKLHGWIDDRIEDWRAANGVFGPIPWQGRWEGVTPTEHEGSPAAAMTHEAHDHRLHELEQAAAILGKCPGRYTFWMVE